MCPVKCYFFLSKKKNDFHIFFTMVEVNRENIPFISTSRNNIILCNNSLCTKKSCQANVIISIYIYIYI